MMCILTLICLLNLGTAAAPAETTHFIFGRIQKLDLLLPNHLQLNYAPDAN